MSQQNLNLSHESQFCAVILIEFLFQDGLCWFNSGSLLSAQNHAGIVQWQNGLYEIENRIKRLMAGSI